MHRHQFYPGRNGNRYSARNISKPVNFVCRAPDAREVYITGEFNEWNPTSHPMSRHPDGAWHAQLQLGHGHHQYRFLVDGKPMLDPKAQGIARDPQGGKTSLIAVS